MRRPPERHARVIAVYPGHVSPGDAPAEACPMNRVRWRVARLSSRTIHVVPLQSGSIHARNHRWVESDSVPPAGRSAPARPFNDTVSNPK